MTSLVLFVDSYFDGSTLRSDGPYRIAVDSGRIVAIDRQSEHLPATLPGQLPAIHCAFLMPGMVEAHCHLFLDGAELDNAKRSAYLSADFDSMVDVARRNARSNLESGITLIRDAGDRFGVNHAIRDELRSPEIRSAGRALNSPGRYGSFMSLAMADRSEIAGIIRDVANTSDDLKIILTGIINFESGSVAGKPQFDVETLHELVTSARDAGLKSFAHCSGIEGLRVAVAAAVDSIEHGFFMDEATLDEMAKKSIAWVPTFSPVHFQWLRPQHCGWNDHTIANLRRILDSHAQHLRLAADKGVAILAGSDAGSYGVVHGKSLIEEMLLMHDCGLPMVTVLTSATSMPRTKWGAESADILIGNAANLVGFDGSPFKSPTSLRKPRFVLHGNALLELE